MNDAATPGPWDQRLATPVAGRGPLRPLRVLMLCWHFPPSPATGGLRPARFVKFFPPWVQAEVLTPADWTAGWHNAQLLDQVRERAVVHRAPVWDWLRWQAADDARGAAALAGKVHKTLMTSLAWVPDREVAWHAGALSAGLSLLRSGRFDVLYSTSPPHSLQRVARRLKQLTGVPLVVDFRDPWTDNPHRPPSSGLRLALERRMEWAVLRDADAIVANTPGNRRTLLRSFPGLPVAKVQVITNGYDPERAPDPTWAPDTDPERPRRLVFAGHLYSGMRCLVDALEVLSSTDPTLHRRACFVFLGSLDRSLQRQFRRVATPALVERGAHVPSHAIMHELACADALVYVVPPNGPHWIPSKLYDYLQARRPILALLPRGDAWDLLAASGMATLVENTDAAACARGIRRFVAELEAGRVPATPREGLAERFDFRRLAARMAAVLAAAAGHPRAAEAAREAGAPDGLGAEARDLDAVGA